MYLLVENFNQGLDTRRMFLTSKAGSLQKLKNAHITRGGEIEKRKAFASFATLPSGTFGLQAAGGSLYVFGSGVQPYGFPASLNYQRLQHPSGQSMTKLVYSETFNGKIYAIANFADGSTHHFYDGNRVTAWDTIASSVGSNSGIAASLAAQVDAEDAFIAVSTGSVITITGVTINQPFTVTGTAVNGGSINDQSITVATTQVADAANPQISTVTIGGTFEKNDIFTLALAIPSISYSKTFQISSSASGVGTVVRTFNNKMYSITRSLLYFSDLGDPSQFTFLSKPLTPNGSGFINLSNQDNGFEDLQGIGIYIGKLAVISRRAVQIWQMDADPTKNVFTQILKNIGTFAPRSVTNFGDMDVFFLSDTGVRSLRARDASNAATVSDVGTNIDSLLATDLASLDDVTKANAVGIIEPNDGRYWLAVGSKIYVYSYFPTPGIAAWSTYEPGFAVSDFAYASGRVYARSGNTVYLYGGVSGNQYDNSQVEVVLPYLDAGKPAHVKTLNGIDVTCEGSWDVYVGCDTTSPDTRDLIATVNQSTFDMARIPASGLGTHIGVKLATSSSYSGPAKIGNFASHFDINDAG